MIHGLEKKYAWVGALHRQLDWTDGCIAVTNAEIEEVFRLVPVGTRVEIKP
jgi:murein L,D-transpeptidase YafK